MHLTPMPIAFVSTLLTTNSAIPSLLKFGTTAVASLWLMRSEPSEISAARGSGTDESLSVPKKKMHGRDGKGRFKAFALGRDVEWDTVYLDDDDLARHFVIKGRGDRLRDFEIGEVLSGASRSHAWHQSKNLQHYGVSGSAVE